MKLADMTEKEWDRQLFNSKDGLATMLGWDLTYHTLRSKGSRSGFPDRTCVRERILFVETKKVGAKPTDQQRLWLDRLAKAGGEVYLWRPYDLDEIGKVLGYRWHLNAGELRREHAVWRPGSLWIPGEGRADGKEK